MKAAVRNPRVGAKHRWRQSGRLITLLVLAAVAFFSGVEPARGETGRESAEIYNRANESYAVKDYRSALKLYRELIERGVKNPDLYYNLGNAYYKAGNLGYAILNYEKALVLKPFDKDIRENLEYAQRSLKERIRPLYNERLYALTRSLSSFLKPGTVAYIELFFLALLIGVANLYIYNPYGRAKAKKYLLACLVLFTVSAVSLLWYHSYEKNHPRGIIVEKEVSVLSAPIAESEALFTLHEGTEMRLREARGDWARISIADGREGWTLAQNILFI